MSGRREIRKRFAEGVAAVRSAIGANKSCTGYKVAKLTQSAQCTEERVAENMEMAILGGLSHRRLACLHLSCPSVPQSGRWFTAASHPWNRSRRATHLSTSSSTMQRLLASGRIWHSGVAIDPMWHSSGGSRQFLHSSTCGGQKGREGSRHSKCVHAAFGKDLPSASPPHLQMQVRAPGRSSSTSAVAECTASPPAGLRDSRVQARGLNSVQTRPDTGMTWGAKAGAAAAQHLNGSELRPEKTSAPTVGPAEQGSHAEAVTAAAAAGGMVEGTVHRVTYKSNVNGFTILQINAVRVSGKPPPSQANGAAAPRKGASARNLITVVGTFPDVNKGSQLRCAGHWEVHKTHGLRLKAINFEEVVPDSPDAIAAYLSSVIDGVGPAYAKSMVKEYGNSILRVLDSPNAAEKLAKCQGIGKAFAGKIKLNWDESRGNREARDFLRKLGVGGRLAQTLVERDGVLTEARLRQDPYSALFSIPGVSFRVAEDVAAAVEAPAGLPSRGAMAMVHTLQLAADKAGHTHLPWNVLLTQALRLMSSSGKAWQSVEELEQVALRLQERGLIVVEPPNASLQTKASPFQPALPPLSEVFPTGADRAQSHSAASTRLGSSSGAGEPDWQQAAQDSVRNTSLAGYLVKRMSGVGPVKAKQMVSKYGVGILEVLDGRKASAEKELASLQGIGKVTAGKMKSSWDATKRKFAAWVDPVASAVGSSEEGPSAGEPVVDPAAARSLPWPWQPDWRCYLAKLHHAEIRVADVLARIASQDEQEIENKEERFKWKKARVKGQESPEELSDGQKAAVLKASTAPLVVLTGGPGCGKTSATKAIVQLWQSQGKDIRLAAPTGRAAQRLQAEAGSQECKAMTLHRLLGYKPLGGGGRRSSGEQPSAEAAAELEGDFVHNAKKPLECSKGAMAVLVDEASMVDMSLAAALLDALPTNVPVQLVLVGDADQLPPVGAGSFLAAAIQSGAVPVVDLREVFRQAQGSAIVKAAHAVHAGLMPPLQRINPEAPSREMDRVEALWVEPPIAANIEDAVVRTVSSGLLERRNINVKTDLQVLSPLRKGPAGVQALNVRLQALLNPPQPGRVEISMGSAVDQQPQILRLGDRVIQAVNNYEKDVYNGDPGYVSLVDAKARRVCVDFPTASAGPKRVEYVGAELWEIELAWATTVHKAQGSESKAVVVVLSPGHRPLLTRRLLYTALTRAREAVIVVGPEAAIRTALQDVQGDVRLTSLHQRLAAATDSLGLARCQPMVYGNGFSVPSNGAALSASVAASVQSASSTAPWENGQLDGMANVEVGRGKHTSPHDPAQLPAHTGTENGSTAHAAEAAADGFVQRPPGSRSRGMVKPAHLLGLAAAAGSGRRFDLSGHRWAAAKGAPAQKLQDEAA